MRFTRALPNEFEDIYVRCSVCSSYNKPGVAREGGQYSSPYPGVSGASLIVYGSKDLWLAGMPPGSTASLGSDSSYSTAPGMCPSQVPLTLVPGQVITVTTTGSTTYGPLSTQGPYEADGDSATIVPHYSSDDNGIEDITAPACSLLGVFLTDSDPSLTAAPGTPYDFTLLATRDYTSLAPPLKKPFFIGTGRTSASALRTVTVPSGATRLFFGTMDGFGFANNLGTLSVTVLQGTAAAISSIDDIDTTTGIAFFDDAASSTGCWFCGSPAWRTGGKAGDLK